MTRKIITLCGSTRFYEHFQRKNYELTMEGHIVLSVGFYLGKFHSVHGETVGCTTEQKIALDELHFDKIRMSDEIFVLNVDGYVGESTSNEIALAIGCGIPVRWLDAKEGEEYLIECAAELANRAHFFMQKERKEQIAPKDTRTIHEILEDAKTAAEEQAQAWVRSAEADRNATIERSNAMRRLLVEAGDLLTAIFHDQELDSLRRSYALQFEPLLTNIDNGLKTGFKPQEQIAPEVEDPHFQRGKPILDITLEPVGEYTGAFQVGSFDERRQKIVSKTLDTTGTKTAYGQDRPKLWCWLRESNKHGLCYHEPYWAPAGELPEWGEVVRAPWLDEVR